MTTARSLRLASFLFVLLLTPLPAAAQFSSALQGTITDTQQAFVPECDGARHQYDDRRHAGGDDLCGRRLSRPQPRGRRVYGRGREGRISQGPARTAQARHQRNAAPRFHARGLGRDRNRDGRVACAARRDRAGPRVRPRRSHAAAGDAAQRPESLQPDRAAARRHRPRGLGVDQRRRRRRRFVRRRVRAAHQRQRPAGRGQQLHRRRHQHQRRGARRHHQPDAEHRVGRGSARRLEQLLRRRRPQPGRADPGDHQGGTNEFRGSGSCYFTSNELSAKNVFETSVPEFSKNQFGYSLGGPIARNRLFFFTSYEGLRQTGARGSTFTVETPEFRNFIQQTRPNSIAAQLLRDFAPGVDPTSNFRDLGSPAPGANVDRPGRRHPRRRHRVLRARRMARWQSVQRPRRLRAEARARIASTATSIARRPTP